MNLQDWASVGEIVSGVGVVISLVYLARQIRQNTRQMEHQLRSQRLSSLDAVEASFTRFRDLIIRDPQVAGLWQRALREYSNLTEDEMVQAGAMLHEYFFIWSNEFDRRKEFGDSSDLGRMRHNMARVVRAEGCRDWWRSNRGYYSDEFAEVVDGIASEEGGA